MKAKVLTGGLEAILVNPYDPINENVKWYLHDHANPVYPKYPLTQPCTYGLIIECNKVWQYRTNRDLVESGVHKEIIWAVSPLTEEQVFELYPGNRVAIRQALEPVAPISENPKTPENRGIKSEGGETVVQAALKEYPVVMDKIFHDNPTDINLGRRIGFIKGAQWQQSQSQQEIIELLDIRINALEIQKTQSFNSDEWDEVHEINARINEIYIIKSRLHNGK